MVTLTPRALTWSAWALFLVLWLFAAFASKRSKRRETVMQRLGYVLPLMVAWPLFSKPQSHHGWLATALFTATTGIQWAGFGAVAAGILFAFWARWHLGTNWSGTVTLKESHELIRTGPYRRIRHPIYTGILLALAGTAIQWGQLAGFLAVIVAWISFYIKARREESFLRDEFGERFTAHAQYTGMFLPRLT